MGHGIRRARPQATTKRLAALLASLTLVGAPGARAQERVWPPPAARTPYPPGLRLFPIALVGEPEGLRVTLSTAEDVKPFLHCSARCAGWAYPGTYWVAVRSTRTTAAGGRKIRLKRPSEIRVRARERDEQAVTTTVGVAMIGGAIGLTALDAALASDQRDAATDPTPKFGILAILAGVVLLAIGGSQDTTVPDVTISP